ncbi:MAG: serine protease [Bacteriovoracaceae bacterium]|nr:serine protease [Bacteriovoracaceae bacterium]
MKYLLPLLLLSSFSARAELFSIIPEKTETPYIRIYEGVRIDEKKDIAKVSVSNLVQNFEERDVARKWHLELNQDTLTMPLSRFNKIKKLSDAVLQATPGDSANSFGTAFHIGNGYVLTNQHVLSTSRANFTECKSFEAKTGDNEDRFDCQEVVHCERKPDFCVIKLKAVMRGMPWNRKLGRAPETLPTLKLKPENLPAFNGIYSAIGNPDGQGIHFSSGRSLYRQADQFIFYAPVHGGNSGGPLLNSDGEAIGLVYAQGQYGIDSEGYNLAVPMEVVFKHLYNILPGDHPVIEILRQN